MKIKTSVLLGWVGVLFSCTSWADTNRMIIKFKPGVQITNLDSAWKMRPLHGTDRFAVVEADSPQQLQKLNALPDIEYIEPDILYSVESPRQKAILRDEEQHPTLHDSAISSSDPRQAELWGIERIGALQAWRQGYTGSRQILVAVIDTGINGTHPDLAPNLWSNAGESGPLANNGVDDDGNGLIDDARGWDFSTQSADTQDDWGHGSHCAGTIGAAGGNGIGVSGVNWHVSLMPVKWMKDGKGWGSDAISAIRYATRMGARILSNSWGGIGYTKALEEAVREAEAAGVLFVASAGNFSSNNDTTPRHPATLKIPNVLAVAATDQNDRLTGTSNFGAQSVHVAAPGFETLSTGLGKSYRILSGTSMAAAHVSGLAALLLSVHPDWKYPELKQALLNRGEALPALKDKVFSGRRIRW